MRSGSDDELVDTPTEGGLPSTRILLAAVLALQLESRRVAPDRADAVPAEVLLSDLGMTIGQIGRLTGRNYETVKSTIRRGREKAAKALPARQAK
jgi:DNA-directed RNA polymerase specialized sigma24 family protein